MVTRFLLAGVLTWASLGAIGSAQTSSSASAPADHAAHVGHAVDSNPSTPAVNESGVLTFAGCLMRHRDVPATPHAGANIQMKHDGYILVNASIVVHHRGSGGMMSPSAIATAGTHDHAATAAGGSSSPAVGAAPFSAGNIGDSQMFKIEGLSEAELSALTGRVVNVTGRLDLAAFAGALAPQDMDHDAAPLKATTIHAATGTCRH